MQQQMVEKQETSQKLPQSVIKVIQDLLGEKINLQQQENNPIIRKCVSIMKLLSDYFTIQKKKAYEK